MPIGGKTKSAKWLTLLNLAKHLRLCLRISRIN